MMDDNEKLFTQIYIEYEVGNSTETVEGELEEPASSERVREIKGMLSTGDWADKGFFSTGIKEGTAEAACMVRTDSIRCLMFMREEDE